MKRIYLSFFEEQKKLAFGDKLIKLKKLVKYHEIFHFFSRNGINELLEQKSAVDRLNSGGALGLRVEALFSLDFSLVRFFSSMEKK